MGLYDRETSVFVACAAQSASATLMTTTKFSCPNRRWLFMQEIYIIAGARTPVAVLQGALSDVTATDLGVVAAKGALDRSGVDPQVVDQVVMGNVIQSSKDAIYFARHIALKVGVP